MVWGAVGRGDMQQMGEGSSHRRRSTVSRAGKGSTFRRLVSLRWTAQMQDEPCGVGPGRGGANGGMPFAGGNAGLQRAGHLNYMHGLRGPGAGVPLQIMSDKALGWRVARGGPARGDGWRSASSRVSTRSPPAAHRRHYTQRPRRRPCTQARRRRASASSSAQASSPSPPKLPAPKTPSAASWPSRAAAALICWGRRAACALHLPSSICRPRHLHRPPQQSTHRSRAPTTSQQSPAAAPGSPHHALAVSRAAAVAEWVLSVRASRDAPSEREAQGKGRPRCSALLGRSQPSASCSRRAASPLPCSFRLPMHVLALSCCRRALFPAPGARAFLLQARPLLCARDVLSSRPQTQ